MRWRPRSVPAILERSISRYVSFVTIGMSRYCRMSNHGVAGPWRFQLDTIDASGEMTRPSTLRVVSVTAHPVDRIGTVRRRLPAVKPST